jgi:cytoskeleton protein RodZ
MVFQPTYTNGISDTTIEMSQDGLRSILNQIEAELLNSEVYRRTMAGLQTMLGEATNTAQILVKAVGREAVRLTFQEFARQYKVVPVVEGNNSRPKELDSHQLVEENLMPETAPLNQNLLEENMIEEDETYHPAKLVDRLIGDTQIPKKTNKTVVESKKLTQERETLLRKVGQELRLAREAKSLTTNQLHSQTLVPLHHIEALEAGHLEHLPEDVYIRGFIRRLAHALGLNGVAIASSLPEPDPVKSVVPSWYQDPASTIGGLQLNSLHLYLGYTALIAGAVGGLSLMSSSKSTPGMSIKSEPSQSSQSVSPPKMNLEKFNKPGVKSSAIGMKAGADIAPPEALPL